MTLQWACEAYATVDDFEACECDCAYDPENEAHVALVEAAIEQASDELCLLSGHSITGLCSVTVTVCRQRCSCRTSCSCSLDTIMLDGPIVEITDVSPAVAGEWDYVFDATDFVIVDGFGIAWAPGVDEEWPVGVFVEITYTLGSAIDSIAKNTALELVCMAVKKCLKAPQNVGPQVGQVQRQGVTFARRQVSFFADITQQAVTDRPWMAEFLALYNPDRTRIVPFLWSPDIDTGVILT